jgi:hypothetical protein
MENMNNTIISSLRIVLAIIITTAVSAVLEIGIINVSHAQVTPGQNPMCDPSDAFVNSTESKICGLPKTPLAPASPATTEPPKPISPSSPGTITPPSETTPTQQGPVPGLLP